MDGQFEVIDEATVKNNHIALLAFFRWMKGAKVKGAYHTINMSIENSFAAIQSRRSKRKDSDEDRQPFDADQLKLIFESDKSINYLLENARYGYQRWLVPLAAYSGARLREMCQLSLTDWEQGWNRYHLLILDDLVYVTKDQSETSVLFELISTRYERRSVLITANQPFGEWGKIFQDPAMTLAAVDRLVHHATIFEMNVESYRRRTAPEIFFSRITSLGEMTGTKRQCPIYIHNTHCQAKSTAVHLCCIRTTSHSG